jgi:acylphosphatase
MKKHLKFKITGKVQGVWYRASMQKEAQSLGVNGIVKNEGDGSVYAEVEGDHLLLKRLADWCWRGPERAKVSDVIIEEGEMEGYDSFEVVR